MSNRFLLPVFWLRFCAFSLVFSIVFLPTTWSQGCSQPSNLVSNVIASGTVALNWSAPGGALNYTVQYRVGNAGPWLSGGTVATTNQTLSGLLPETVYTWRVRASCSTFSSVATFNTGGAPGGNTACSSPSNQTANVTSPSAVVLGWSASQGAFYYTVQYRPNNVGAWINAGSVTGTSITVSNLSVNTEYGWRVKASCSVYSSVALFNTGANGAGGNTSCSQPSNLDALPLSTTSVEVNWSAIQEAQNYTVQYRLGLNGAWITMPPVTGTSLTLNNLLPGFEYSWRVKASCSDYSSQAVFTVPGTGGGSGGGSTSCSAPSNTNTLSVAPTSAVVTWEPQGGALNYTVQYRLELGGTYTTVGTFTTATATIAGLAPGTQYVWRVKANCSPYGSDVQFTTPLARINQSVAARMADAPAPLHIYPNPTTQSQVQIAVQSAGTLVQVFNTTGRLVAARQTTDLQTSLDVSNWQNGLYLVRVCYDNGGQSTAKLIVAH